jgi:hypothetical protein
MIEIILLSDSPGTSCSESSRQEAGGINAAEICAADLLQHKKTARTAVFL